MTNSKTEKYGPALWKEKLVTKEDPQHIHKTLGFLSLVSFIYRVSQIGESDMGFVTNPELTVPTLLLHFILTASSFTFKIPKKRISSGGRIWPEYRIQNLAFLTRSLATVFLVWYEQTRALEPNYSWNVVIVISTLAFADFGSYWVGKDHQSSTIRNLEIPNYVRFSFTAMQFLATAHLLMGVRRYSANFYGVLVLQVTSFLMTLQRKNLLGHYPGVAIYGLMLIMPFSFPLSVRNDKVWYNQLAMARNAAVVIGGIACLIRVGPLPGFCKPIQNKYVLWALMGLLAREIRPTVESWDDARLTPEQLAATSAVVFGAVLGLGWYTVAYGYAKRKQKVV